MKGNLLRILKGLVLASLLNPASAVRAQSLPLDTVIRRSLNLAEKQYMNLAAALPTGRLPRTLGPDGRLLTCDPGWWTSGFFPGSLWYLYEYSGSPALKKLAADWLQPLEAQQYNDHDHDIGFKMNCSFGNAYRITGNPEYKKVLLQSAATLLHRYNPVVGAIRSWGDINDSSHFLVIIDNMMNLELLFEATRLSADSSYYKIAVSHANTTLANHFRPDGSSYHVLEYDPRTGAVTRKRTQQGFSDASAWARGQAWGLYGFTVCFRYTHDPRYLAQARKIAHFILGKGRLPADKIPYWDFDAPRTPAPLRDASAGAIMASALLELSKDVSVREGAEYRRVAAQMIRSLSRPPYRNSDGEDAFFLLQHSVGSLPQHAEVDVPLSYADYYYIEAMLRYLCTDPNR